MAESDRKPPAFFCPSCGQKHRADPAPLKKAGAEGLKATCRNCGATLRVRLEEAGPVSEVIEPPPEARSRRSTPAAAAPTGGPYEEELASPLEEGEQVGRYAVKRLLSQGRTSAVYLVDDPTTKRSVALKVLRSGATDVVRKQFLRQVEVQANIRHPNIMPVYDRGALEDGRPYFTAELLHRPAALVDVLERRQQGKLAGDKALAEFSELEALVEQVLIPVADGIYVANIENGVVHGDLRPENVLIDRRTKRPYLTDFGASHELVEGRARATVGLSHYVSPEQARGWVYPRTDVWGLGALLFTCLSGQSPLEGRGDALRQHALAGQYRPLDGEAPPQLVAIARKAMASEPEARYVNARQMVADLKAWLKGGRVRAVEEFGGADATALATKKQVRQHLRVVGWIAAGLVVGLLVGSQIRIGGEDPGEVRVGIVEAGIDRLASDVDDLSSLGPAERLALDDAAEVWLGLERRADELAARLERAPPSRARASVAARLAFVRKRFAALPVRIEAPESTPIRAVNEVSGRAYDLTPPTAHLPPGPYAVTAGEGSRAARFPARIPLYLVPAGQEAQPDVPCTTWVIPTDPKSLPKERTLVIGCAVHLEGPPQAAPDEAIDVDTFAVSRVPITNAQYARFLNALPQADRSKHAPRVAFEEIRGIWRPARHKEDLAVAGIDPEDAMAYCAWRSKEEGVTVRLPNAAEWRLLSGVRQEDLARGDLRPRPEKSPYGVLGIEAGRRELVTAPDGTPRYGLRGGTTRPAEATDDAATFRCVQEL